MLSLLDVTLRDGGYTNAFNFDKQDLINILNALNKSAIEYIEIGYRNGSIKNIPSIGITGMCPDAFLKFARRILTNTKIAVMVHPQNILNSDLASLKNHSVDFFKKS